MLANNPLTEVENSFVRDLANAGRKSGARQKECQAPVFLSPVFLG
jgi:hypothetical protein